MQLGTLLASLKERGGRLTHPKPPGKVLNLKRTRQVCIATKPQVLPSTCLSVCCGVRWDADRCAGANLLLRWLSATMHVLAAAWAAMPEQAGNIQAWRAAVVFARAPCMPNAFHAAKGAVLGIEPRTSRTLSENHATRPNSQLDAEPDQNHPCAELQRPSQKSSAVSWRWLPQQHQWLVVVCSWAPCWPPLRKGEAASHTPNPQERS